MVPSACRRHRRVTVQTTEEAPVSQAWWRLRIRMSRLNWPADSMASSRTLAGPLAASRSFCARRTTADDGAVAICKFAIPDVLFAKLGTVSLSCYVNGTAQPPETYTKAGQYTYTRDVPANLVTGEVARVDFSLDKTIPASPSYCRELGVVVSMIGLQPR